MRFAYGRYEVEPTPSQPGVTVIYRPVIPIRLIGTTGEAVFYGLLDTGADETPITREMADVLGVAVDETEAHTAASATGEMAVVYGRVTIAVGQADESYRWRAQRSLVPIARSNSYATPNRCPSEATDRQECQAIPPTRGGRSRSSCGT